MLGRGCLHPPHPLYQPTSLRSSRAAAPATPATTPMEAIAPGIQRFSFAYRSSLWSTELPPPPAALPSWQPHVQPPRAGRSKELSHNYDVAEAANRCNGNDKNRKGGKQAVNAKVPRSCRTIALREDRKRR